MDLSFEEIALQRFGYGRRLGETAPFDLQALLDQVEPGAAKAVGFVQSDSKSRISHLRRLTLRRREAKRGKRPEEASAIKRERISWLRTAYASEAHARVLWSVTQADSFFERLAFFWADHFTVSMAKSSLRALVGSYEAEAVRPYIAGDFRNLLRKAALHPGMQLYLDQNRSVGPASKVGRRGERGLNENLGREIIELHTLGVGAPYTQADVRQFAKLLTGVTVDEDEGIAVYDVDRAEPGTETVLGQRYGKNPEGLDAVLVALDDLARHPATARHLARKLAVHFLSDDPPEAVVQHLAATYSANDTQLMPVYRALLEHPASWQTFGQKVRQPFDYLVALLRVSLSPGREARITKPKVREFMAQDGMMISDPRAGNFPFTLAPLNAMGQLPWSAPGPNGWPEAAAAWISPQGLTERIQFATHLARGPLKKIEPRDLLVDAFGANKPDRVALLVKEAGDDREARSLILASPEIQRR